MIDNNNDSCLNTKDKSLTLRQAKERCFATINTLNTMQRLDIRLTLNRVLAQDIIATINVPNHRNSAMDGYALRKKDLINNKLFEVIATIYAGGAPFAKKILSHQCVQVMTGAIMPDDTDIVIPKEFIKQQARQISVDDYEGFDNIRLPGEDLAKGSVAIEKGHLLKPADLGLLASLGIAEVDVWRKLRVAFFSTGDELRPISDNLSVGQVYDSNRYSLYGLLTNMGVDLIDMGVIKDNPDALKNAFISASQCADVIITTGGVSVGAADFIKQVLADIGKINFWKLAIKPGRPLTFGTINQAYFFGLPGNPVAVMITFYQVVAPFLKKMSGQTQNIETLLVDAINAATIVKSPGRTEFIRAVLSRDNGKLVVEKLQKQGSGILSTMSKANCLIVLSAESGTAEAGQTVKVQPFYGLV